MAKYSVNHMERKIILTKQFASEAKKLDSDSYKILKQLDRFGFDTPIKKIDEDCFEITVSVALNADFYGWLVTLGGRVTIISPNRASRGFRITCSRVQHWMLNEYKAKRKKKFFYFVD